MTTVRQQLFVSVIVAARNEEYNIDRCLRHLAAQAYPGNLFEIIAVNDRSADRTGERIERMSRLYPNISQINISNVAPGVSGKKNALASGIAAARGEIIVTTDADCIVPPDWIRQTVELFDSETGMVVGPAPFVWRKSAFKKIMSMDNLWSALISAGGLGWNVGITCTGRNLAYRKSAYEKVEGFREVEHSTSGDDDLLLHLLSRKTNWKIRYNLSHQVSVLSEAPGNIGAFIRQRRRHVSAAKYYNRSIKVGYLASHLANTCLFALPVLSYGRKYFLVTIVLLVTKLCLDLFVIRSFAAKIGRTHVTKYAIPWELFNLINQAIISPLGFIGKIRWR